MYIIIITPRLDSLGVYIIDITSLANTNKKSYDVIIYNEQTLKTNMTLDPGQVTSWSSALTSFDGYSIIGVFLRTTENYLSSGVCQTTYGTCFFSLYNHYNSALTFNVYATVLYKNNRK